MQNGTGDVAMCFLETVALGKNCLLQKPVWCNVQYPACIEACKTVVEQDRRKVAEEFELPIVDKYESDLIKLNIDGVTKTIL